MSAKSKCVFSGDISLPFLDGHVSDTCPPTHLESPALICEGGVFRVNVPSTASSFRRRNIWAFQASIDIRYGFPDKR